MIIAMTRDRLARLVPGLVGALWTCAALAGEPAHLACAESGGVTPLCGFERPEDIEVIAERHLLVSEYGSLAGARTGRLVVFDPATATRRVVYPHARDDGPDAVTPGWGDAQCPGPPPAAVFSPHGIHHAALAGLDRVLVVNHGGREAIEFFELVAAEDAERVALRWRGCVVAPDGIWMNDVVGLPDNAFAATHMLTRGTGEEALFAIEHQRSHSGWVVGWSQDTGWSKIRGTDGGMPNGIEVSSDGGTLYVNEYFGDRVTAVERASGRRLWSVAVNGPDNSSWSSDGLLLVAGHMEGLQQVLACNEHLLQACTLRYRLVAIRPQDGASAVLFDGGGGDPMGAATVAAELDGKLYLGSYVGDRIVRIERPALPAFDSTATAAGP